MLKIISAILGELLKRWWIRKKDFQELIKSMKPDCVICTHFVCANSAAKARMNMDKKFAIISVPTDYETEGLWPHKETDLFCVAIK